MGSSCLHENYNKKCEVNLEKENDQSKYSRNISVNQNVIIINTKDDFKNTDNTSKMNNRREKNCLDKIHENGFILKINSKNNGNKKLINGEEKQEIERKVMQLNEREKNLIIKEDEFEKNKEKKKEEVDERENNLIIKEDEFEKNKEKEKQELEKRIMELNERENNLKKKEEEYQKNKEPKEKELETERRNIQLDDSENNLKQKEDEFEKNKEKEKQELEKRNIELNERENNLKIKEDEFEKNKEKKKQELEKRNIELNERENNLKQKEDEFEKNKEKKKQELDERENNLKIKEDEFEKNKEKIIENKIKEREKPILVGLNNIGATCYMNATLQCLSNTKKLTEYFLNSFTQKENQIMSNEYYKLLLDLWDRNKNNKSFSPNSFKEVLSKENPLFKGIAANDSKDLINFLIERFHSELNVKNINNINNINNNDNYITQDQTNEQNMYNIFLQEFKENYNSPISDLFYGIIEIKSQCKVCQILKYNFQIFSFLEFPLQQVNQYYYNMGRRPLFCNDGTNPDVNLYECFEYYRKLDLMNGDNQMYCMKCNISCDAFYSTSIFLAPKNLIINLNRGRDAVYECKVYFPEQLNILNFVSYQAGVTFYQLYAVICHLGPSSMSGHFVAYCRNRMDNKWYLYNDGFVTPCTKDQQYQDGMPYILFYRSLGDI